MNPQSVSHTLLSQSSSESLKARDYKSIKVKILMTNQQELLGTVIIPAKGYKSRLSDLMNNAHNFLALTDVEVYQKNVLLTKTPFLSVNKASIIYLAEDEDNEINNRPFIKVEISDYD